MRGVDAVVFQRANEGGTSLLAGAPFGSVRVDSDTCTTCIARPLTAHYAWQ